MPRRSQERVCHTASDQQRIDSLDQVLQDAQLGRDFRSSDDGDQRPTGVLENPAKGRQLLLHEQARDGR
jgi:hypothetical protein